MEKTIQEVNKKQQQEHGFDEDAKQKIQAYIETRRSPSQHLRIC
jgi:hypothetical protein